MEKKEPEEYIEKKNCHGVTFPHEMHSMHLQVDLEAFKYADICILFQE